MMERAYSLPDHRVYVANARDTTALEPTLELIERFLSTARARRELDWQPRYSWRDWL